MKKKKSKLLIILLILAISVGYALLSSNLKITGIAGINKNTWDIHWNDESIVETPGSVTATTPAYVSDQEKKIVSFTTELELPGDFYEFTVDAKNYGSINGILKNVVITFYEADGTTKINTLPSYIKYSFTTANGTEVPNNQVIEAGQSKKYKFRIEFDKEATTLPSNPEVIKPVIEIPIEQTKQEDNSPYVVTFNPNGGTVSPTTKEVVRGEKVGSLPTPTNGTTPFLGWYTSLNDGTKITENTIPTGDTTYYAHWSNSYTMFDTGKNVNAKFKKLAGNEEPVYYSTSDTKITSIVRSNTAPDTNTTTEIVSLEGLTPIYAWFDNGTIYYYSTAQDLFLNSDSSYMFYNLENVTSIDTSFNTSTSTDMTYLFAYCDDLTSIDLSNFDTSNVTDMSYMFYYCSGLTELDVSSFDTGNVTSMYDMFYYCGSLEELDLSTFKTSNVTDLGYIVGSCNSLTELNLSNFDLSRYNSGSLMYNYIGLGSASNLKTLILDNAILPANMNYGFGGLESVEEISLRNVNTSNLVIMNSMFYGDTNLKSLDLSSFDTSHVTDMRQMISLCPALTELNMSNFDFRTYNPPGALMNYLGGAQNIKKIGLDNAIISANAQSYFGNASNIEEISTNNINTSNVTNMSYMFYDCGNLKAINLDDFDTSHVVTTEQMFFGCSSLTSIDVSHLNTSNVTNMFDMFYGCTGLTSIDLSTFNTSNVTNMEGLIGNNNLVEANLNNFDFSKYNPDRQLMNYIGLDGNKLKRLYLNNVIFPSNLTTGFKGLSGLEVLSLNNVDTSNVTKMTSLFSVDTSLTSIDLSSFDTRNVTDMNGMFQGLSNLTTIYVGNNFIVTGVASSSTMFEGCTSLVGGNGTTYSSSHIDKEYARIDTDTTPGYFSSKTGISNVGSSIVNAVNKIFKKD